MMTVDMEQENYDALCIRNLFSFPKILESLDYAA